MFATFLQIFLYILFYYLNNSFSFISGVLSQNCDFRNTNHKRFLKLDRFPDKSSISFLNQISKFSKNLPVNILRYSNYILLKQNRKKPLIVCTLELNIWKILSSIPISECVDWGYLISFKFWIHNSYSLLGQPHYIEFLYAAGEQGKVDRHKETKSKVYWRDISVMLPKLIKGRTF